ncbi:hypothetical protein PPL_07794 [Heterostelium album PN500]|uniref:SD-repeat containing protein B domain-containing protein n=1 Tax=Heterostelium pallidum (strain ATCC 26659 / Pp 5 / PN500) TaxID=670386 RepID=D3BGZ2_HETP5|nr:hypothetical protein PPL_07794 [Heterostelium album PN500]EFA79376.1 hypothetical protein PPL_07794 [Heterostelium album PN500]|eukprot:XP_020431497.1 hypothetical protein PPL_07794 [Heterostelium album PN500]
MLIKLNHTILMISVFGKAIKNSTRQTNLPYLFGVGDKAYIGDGVNTEEEKLFNSRLSLFAWTLKTCSQEKLINTLSNLTQTPSMYNHIDLLISLKEYDKTFLVTVFFWCGLVDPTRNGVICDYCVPEKTYLDFSSFQPHAFEHVKSGVLQWAQGFPKVRVSLQGNSSPLMLGFTHLYSKLLSNPKFFNITGNQDIKSLMHSSCGTSPSNITLEFLEKSTMNFIFVIYGVTSESSVVIDAYDAYGYPINMLNWKTLDHGILSSSEAMHPPAFSMTPEHTTMNITWSGVGANSYVALQPNQMVSKIVISTKGNYCDVPCKSVLHYFSLIGIGNCTNTTTNPQKYAIGSMVFQDDNSDGIHQPNELYYPGVTVQLLQSGQIIRTTVTDSKGNYLFDNLEQGTYSIQFTVPIGKQVSPTGVGKDSVVDPNGHSQPIVLSPSTTQPSNGASNATLWNPNINMGLINAAQPVDDFTITGKVCNDINGNGISEAGEGYFQGIRVNLLDAYGNLIKYTVSTSTGMYRFDNIKSGKYQVQFVLPNGYKFTHGASSQVDSNGIANLVINNDTTGLTKTMIANACVMLIPKPPTLFAIGDHVFEDVNKDGLYDASIDKALPGVTVNLYNSQGLLLATTKTDENGLYHFDSLESGDYNVHFIPPSNSFISSPTTLQSPPDKDGWVYRIKLTQDTTSPTGNYPNIKAQFANFNIDAGFYKQVVPPKQNFTIGKVVFEDMDGDGLRDPLELGIPNVHIEITDENGIFVSANTTDLKGEWSISNLPAGKYCMKVTKPSEYSSFSPKTTDSVVDQSGKTCFTLLDSNPTKEIDNLNTGIIPTFYQVTGNLKNDVDKSNTMTAGDESLRGVSVVLLDSNGNVIATTTTTPNGDYKFDKILAGEYTIHVPKIPDGTKWTENSPDSKFTDGKVDIDLSPGNQGIVNNVLSNMNGLVVPSQTFSAGGSVFIDNNNDKVKDSNDQAIPEITVTLSDRNGNVLQTIKTDKDGKYEFKDLPGSDYCIEIKTPEGSTFTTDGGNKQCFKLNSDQTSTDFGIKPTKYGITGTLFEDTDKNNKMELDDKKLGGIEVQLLDKDGKVLQTTTTKDDGTYSFNDLPTGKYSVSVPKIPEGTKWMSGSSDSKFVDSKVDVDLSPDNPQLVNNILPNINGGVTPPESTKYGITGTFFEDTDKNNKMELDDKKLGGIEVQLLDKDGKVLQTTTTKDDGTYSFNDLPTGKYTVSVPKIPEGTKWMSGSSDSKFVDSKVDVDLSPDNSQLVNNILPSINGGVTPPESTKYGITGTLFEDTDLNNQIGLEDVKLVGIEVQLLDKDGKVLQTTTTKDDGTYSFNDLPTGKYSVSVPKIPEGTKWMSGSSDSKFVDSKVDVDLSPDNPQLVNNILPNINGGVTPPESTKYGITGTLFEDTDKNNKMELDDKKLGGIEVQLLDKDGKVLQTTTTKDDGTYSFNDLPTGKYSVSVPKIPEGTKWMSGSSDSKFVDSKVDVDLSPDNPQLVNNILPNINGGVTPPEPTKYGITGTLFEDTDKNNKMELDDKKLGGIEVQLLDKDGKVLQTTTTKDDGTYSFNDLPTGKYTVSVPKIPEGTKWMSGSSDSKFVDSKVDVDLSPDNSQLVNNILPNINGGVTPPESTKYGITGTLFEDTDLNNQIGLEDVKLVGIEVQLLDKDGNVLQTTTTKDDGTYSFNDLPTGKYSVSVPKIPEGTKWMSGSSDSKFVDSKVDVDLSPDNPQLVNNILPNINGGVTPPESTKYGITGTFFEDTDKNNKMELDDKKLGGIEVQLLDKDGNVLQTTTTKDDGTYSFNDLPTGKYSVLVPKIPEGTKWMSGSSDSKFVDSKVDVDLSPDNSQLVNNILPNINGGVVPPSTFTIISYAWLDRNKDGLINENSSYLSGLEFTLTDSSGKVLQKLTTDASKGNKTIEIHDLPAGEYCATMIDPTGKFSKDTSNEFDSDFVENKYCFNLNEETTDEGVLDIASGRIDGRDYSINGYSWIDKNNNGKDDSGEPYLSGIEGSLVDENGNEVAKFTTDDTKKSDAIDIKGLKAGSYCLIMKDPTGKYQESGPNPVTPPGRHCFELNDLTAPKQIYNFINGQYPTYYNLTGYSWIDASNDGIDSGEEYKKLLKFLTLLYSYLGDMLFKLFDSNDKEVYSKTTVVKETDKTISIPYLVPGNYCAIVTDPSDRFIDSKIGKDNKFENNKYCFELPKATTESKSPYFQIASAFAWVDKNENGQDDSGELYLAGMDFKLTNNKTGEVIFEKTTVFSEKSTTISIPFLPEGDYCATMTDPKGIYGDTKVGKDNNFLSDIQYELKDSSDKVIFTTTTDASKRYKGTTVEGLKPGQYCATMTDPTGKYKNSAVGIHNKFVDNKYCFTLDTVNEPDPEVYIRSGFIDA